MSARHRKRLRRGRHRLRFHRTDWVAVQHGGVADLADASQVESCRQQTHDALVAGLGDRRRGGIRWVQFTAADALDRYDELVGPRPEFEGLRQALEAHPAGGLIVALCDAIPEDVPS